MKTIRNFSSVFVAGFLVLMVAGTTASGVFLLFGFFFWPQFALQMDGFGSF